MKVSMVKAQPHPLSHYFRIVPLVVVLSLGALSLAPKSAQANVYATAIKLNGAFTNAVAGTNNVLISYVLNEAATAGVTVQIKAEATIVRSITVAPGSAGALKGTNSVTWDRRDNIGHVLGSGLYGVSVTAAASGYGDWTQTSADTNIANQIWEGRGIAVNKNTNSIFYGRIFIGNAQDGPNADINPLDRVGIHKVNADGSFAQEGGYSDGGYDWAHGSINDDFSPWKLEVGQDDRLYANDYYLLPGVVLSFDQIISSNSQKMVLNTSNYTNNSQSQFSGMTVTGSGTNLQLWMADASIGGMGVRRWNITASGTVASNDYGSTIVAAGAGSDLDQFPEDVAVDASNRIYVVQRREFPSDPSMRLFRFPAYAGSPETNADWKIGSGDDTMAGAYGVAVDPTGAFVAAAFRGLFGGPNGAARVFSTSNGTPVAALTPTTNPSHDHWDVTWDNVGNLYAIDNYDGIWRTYSPPGSNQATTLAVPVIQINGSSPDHPLLGPPTYDSGFVHFTLYGQPNVTYIIQISTDLQTWTSVATNTSVFANREITIPAPPDGSFIRAVVGPYQPASPVLTSAVRNGSTFQFNLIGEPYVFYTIQASPDLQTWTPVLTNSWTSATNGVSIDSSTSQQFFRAKVGQ